MWRSKCLNRSEHATLNSVVINLLLIFTRDYWSREAFGKRNPHHHAVHHFLKALVVLVGWSEDEGSSSGIVNMQCMQLRIQVQSVQCSWEVVIKFWRVISYLPCHSNSETSHNFKVPILLTQSWSTFISLQI